MKEMAPIVDIGALIIRWNFFIDKINKYPSYDTQFSTVKLFGARNVCWRTNLIQINRYLYNMQQIKVVWTYWIHEETNE